jgi:hypothetical protein
VKPIQIDPMVMAMPTATAREHRVHTTPSKIFTKGAIDIP